MSLRPGVLWKWFAIVAGVVTSVYVLVPTSLWADLALYDGLAALTIVAVLVGVSIWRPPGRAGWLLILGGNLLFLCGELYWSYLDEKGYETFPSFADYLYLSGYLALTAGMIVLAKKHSTVRDMFGALDAAIFASAAALLSWVFLMEPYVSDIELTVSDKFWTLAYPVMDLLVLAVAARLVFALGLRSWWMLLLVGSFVADIVADTLYGWHELQGTYTSGGLIDGVWMMGYALVAMAALHPSVATGLEPGSGRRFQVKIIRLALLGIAALVPPTVLVVQQLNPDGAASGANLVVPAVATGVVFTLVVLRMGGLVATVRRLTERQGQEQFEAMVEHSADVIAMVDAQGNMNYVSPGLRTVYGHEPADLVGSPITSLVAPEDRTPFLSQLEQASQLDSQRTVAFAGEFLRADGDRGSFEAVIANLHDSADGLVVTIRDITARAELERQLSHQAFHDSLTGLPNRALFIDRVEHALARHHRTPEDQVAVMFVDLDDFKSVNDGLGHSAGDDLLVAIGERLRSCMRPGDTVARLGGDEFAILIDGNAGLPQCMAAADRMLEVLQLPLTVGDLEIGARASIGIAAGQAGSTSQTLLRDADTAMYAAKNAGKGRYEIFDLAMRQAATDHLAWRVELTGALERGELRVVYQPILDLSSNKITGAEALLRWQHPKHGNVPPNKFIPVAEQSGLIVSIGRWTLSQACQQAADWQTEEPRSVSVNVSAVQLRDDGFLDDVQRALDDSGLDPRLLIVEVTESVLVNNAVRACAVLESICSLGVRVAIDDFGTGFCSLAYLRMFPVDIIKIDRAFISELSDPQMYGRTLAENILDLAKSLAVPTIAEGIEQTPEADRLRALNCQYGQGFLFAKPLEASELSQLLRSPTPTSPAQSIA